MKCPICLEHELVESNTQGILFECPKITYYNNYSHYKIYSDLFERILILPPNDKIKYLDCIKCGLRINTLNDNIISYNICKDTYVIHGSIYNLHSNNNGFTDLLKQGVGRIFSLEKYIPLTITNEEIDFEKLLHKLKILSVFS